MGQGMGSNEQDTEVTFGWGEHLGACRGLTEIGLSQGAVALNLQFSV